MPSVARMPRAVPACDMASSAYSTWYRRPSGEKMVVRLEKERSVWNKYACTSVYSMATCRIAET